MKTINGNNNMEEIDEEFVLKNGFDYREAGKYGKSGYYFLYQCDDVEGSRYLFFNNYLQFSIVVVTLEGVGHYLDFPNVTTKEAFIILMGLLDVSANQKKPIDSWGIYDNYEQMVEAEIKRLIDNPNV